MKKAHLLYLVILIEGYVVLAAELLAIRQLVPFVGSGVETTSIIISAVLLPLALGYHYGGIAYARAYAKRKERRKGAVTIRALLTRNILISLFILTLGFSYLLLEFFFWSLSSIGISHRLSQTAIYVLVFLVTPTFLLGQTVPLASHFFSKQKLSAITGRMLFFSTVGAFLGSLFSTLVLMSFLGVHNTVIFTMVLLALLGVLVAGRRRRSRTAWLSLIAVFLAVFLNNGLFFKWIGVVSDNAYSLVRLDTIPDSPDTIMMINRSAAAKMTQDPSKRIAYIAYTEKYFIDPYLTENRPKRDVLVIGAGGFEIGRYDLKSNYTFVDIDPALHDIAENHFRKESLAPNKKFVAASARSFVRQDTNKYDLIFIDVCTNVIAIPMEAVTQEFFTDVKARLKKGGAVVANVVVKPSFGDKFSARYYNTFSSVFHKTNRQLVEQPDLTTGEDVHRGYDELANVLHIYVDQEASDDRTVYTDDLNTHSLDVP